MRHGEGTLENAEGDAFTGRWQNDELEGSAKVKYRNGNYYVGYIHKWKPEGRGVLRLLDGTEFKGDFMNGKRHGMMTIVHSDGAIEKALYVADIRIEGARNN